jgi:hypothetical protein
MEPEVEENKLEQEQEAPLLGFHASSSTIPRFHASTLPNFSLSLELRRSALSSHGPAISCDQV